MALLDNADKKYGDLSTYAGLGAGTTGNPITSMSLQAALELFDTLRKIPGKSMADVYSGVGNMAWDALKKPGQDLANLAYQGVKNLKGEPLKDNTQKSFYDVANELPSSFKPTDIVKGVGKLLGQQLSSEEAQKILDMTGIDKALGPIGNLAVSSGSTPMPDITPSGITPMASSGNIPVGMEAGTDAVTGKKLNLDFIQNPVLKTGLALGNTFADELRKQKPSETGLPSIAIDKTLADYLKQGSALGADTATDPTMLLAGAGELGLKGIRAASKLAPTQGIVDLLKMLPNQEITGVGKSGIGKQVFEGFGEFVPRLLGALVGDEEGAVNYFRTPSKIVTPAAFDTIQRAKRDISNFGEYVQARVEPWQNIESPEIRKLVGETLISDAPKVTTTKLGPITEYGNTYTETGKYDALRETIKNIQATNPELLKQFKNPVDDIVKIAQDLRKAATRAGSEAVKAGLLDAQTFSANKEKYAKTFYNFFENPKDYLNSLETQGTPTGLTEKLAGANVPREFAVKKELFKPLGASFETPQDYAKFQKNAGKLGPESIGYSIGEGSKRTYTTSRFGRMYDQLNALPGYSLDDLPQTVKDAMPYQKVVKIGAVDAKLATVEGKSYIQLPSTSKYGSMAAKWVPRADGEYIIGFNKKMGRIEKIISPIMGMWKTGKVPFSTAAQGRNVLFSNPIQMMFNGVDPIDAFKLSSKRLALKMDGKSDMITRIVNRYGGAGSNFADAETMKLNSNFIGKKVPSQFSQDAKKALNVPRKIYGNLENVQKEAMVEWLMNRGVSGKEAYKKTMEALFDYGDKPRFVKDLIRSTAFPFATYSTKALPYVAKTTLHAPMRTLPIIAFKDSWNDKQIQKLNLQPKDINNLRDRYGDWFLITGGTKDKLTVIDLSYSIPGMPDLFDKQTGRGMLKGAAPQALQPASPLQTLLEVMPGINKKFYFGSQVYKDTDPNLTDFKDIYKMLKKSGVDDATAIKESIKATKGGKVADYLLKMVLPSTPAIPGTYQSEQLQSALEGKPINSSGDVQTMPGFVSSMIGLKQVPVNLENLNNSKISEFKKGIKELTSGIISTNLNQRLDAKAKEVNIKIKREQLRKLIEDFRSYNKEVAK